MRALDSTRTDDVRIAAVRPLLTPALLEESLPAQPDQLALVEGSRVQIGSMLRGQDDRLLVVVGPCSIHDHDQAMAYARLLQAQAQRLRQDLLLVLMGCVLNPVTGKQYPVRIPVRGG